MKISFVYPMFNELGNIEKVLRSTETLAQALRLEDHEIIVVDDCSTDGSGELVKQLQAEMPRLRVLRHDRNRHLGAALRTGFAAARLDYILYMDSDLPVAFEDVEHVLRDLRHPPDMLVGYRVGRAEGVYRDLQSWAYNAILRRLFDLRVRDANFAFKLFRREIADSPITSESSFIDAELLLEGQRRGYDIRETGFRYHVRQAGTSTMGGPRVIPPLLRDLARYRWERWSRPDHVSRSVIFNADDFGLSHSINDGVIESHQRGVVRSASVMPTGDAFNEAAEYARANPSLDVGLHFTLCDGSPVSDPESVPTLVDRHGRFADSYREFLRRYFWRKISLRDIETELRAQIAKVRSRGLRVTHFDSHQHLHALPGVFDVVVRIAEEQGIPAVRSPLERSNRFGRNMNRAMQRLALNSTVRMARSALAQSNVRSPDHFLGFVHAGRWNVMNLTAAMSSLRPGITEVCCHPCAGAGEGRETSGWQGNPRAELAALTSDRLQEKLAEEKVKVTGFRDCF